MRSERSKGESRREERGEKRGAGGERREGTPLACALHEVYRLLVELPFRLHHGGVIGDKEALGEDDGPARERKEKRSGEVVGRGIGEG